MRFSVCSFLILITSSLFAQTGHSQKLSVSHKIKQEAQNRIKGIEDAMGNEFGMQITKNIFMGEFTSDDSTTSVLENDESYEYFKGFHFMENGITVINGTFIINSMADDFGFLLQIEKDSTRLFFVQRILHSKETSYRLSSTDTLQKFLKIECNDYKIVLSSLPKKKLNKTIYGYVEFATPTFYTVHSQTKTAMTCSTKMKIYFSSSALNKTTFFNNDKDKEFYLSKW